MVIWCFSNVMNTRIGRYQDVIKCDQVQSSAADRAQGSAPLGGRYLSYDKLIFTIDPLDKNKLRCPQCRMLDALRSNNVWNFIKATIHICISIRTNTFPLHIIISILIKWILSFLYFVILLMINLTLFHNRKSK